MNIDFSRSPVTLDSNAKDIYERGAAKKTCQGRRDALPLLNPLARVPEGQKSSSPLSTVAKHGKVLRDLFPIHWESHCHVPGRPDRIDNRVEDTSEGTQDCCFSPARQNMCAGTE
jgi:hypothetical protein